jgi:2-iminobutanoate/2-iminopropanoate deaminase
MRPRPLATALLLLPFAAPAPSRAADIRFYAPEGAPKPFSAAVRTGDIVHTSGAIGVSPDGTLPAEFAPQVRNAMQAVSAELTLAGASMRDVYKCTVLLSDMKNWAAFNAEYVTFFSPGRLPVRTASGANGLARGAAVEVECEAYAPLNTTETRSGTRR